MSIKKMKSLNFIEGERDRKRELKKEKKREIEPES